MMDFEDQADEEEGLPKWPFLASALFILSGAIGFAYFHYHTSGFLEVWQLLVCILASGTASLLIFMPFLLERSLHLCLLTANRKDDELFRKVYFDLKEVRSELEALAVKIDKVPTLVDKIISDSTKDLNQLDLLSNELSETKEELALKLARLEELASQEPTPIEPDPGIAKANQAIADLTTAHTELGKMLKSIEKQINQLPTEFPEPIIQNIETSSPSLHSEESLLPEEIEESPLAEVSNEKSVVKKQEILTEDAFSPDFQPTELEDGVIEKPEDHIAEPEEPDDDLDSKEFQTSDTPVPDNADEQNEEGTAIDLLEEPEADSQEKLEAETFDDIELADIDLEEKVIVEEQANAEEETLQEETDLPPNQEEPEELDLGLPDPEETLRKVDALLAGESTSQKEETIDQPKSKPTGGVTSVVANVMIGIGNKPYVRGEGPGLSWEEGAPMNFVEIGKWAWSPSRKNATVTIQIYRNDQEPDQGGKYEVKPGEKFEVTPDFG